MSNQLRKVGGFVNIEEFEKSKAALVYGHRVQKRPNGGFEGCYDQGPHNWLTWSDLDGNGRPEIGVLITNQSGARVLQIADTETVSRRSEKSDQSPGETLP